MLRLCNTCLLSSIEGGIGGDFKDLINLLNASFDIIFYFSLYH